MVVWELFVAVSALAVGLLAGLVFGRRYPGGAAVDDRLRALLDTADVGVMVNTRNGRNLYANSRALAFFGIDRAAAAAFNMIQLYADPEERRRHVEALYRHGAVMEDEVRFRRGDGAVFVGRMTSALVDFAGERCHVSWLLDLSDSREADQTRRTLNERLAIALDATNSAAWDFDVVDGSCWWSDSFPRMLGFDVPPDMAPDFWESRLHPDDRDRILSAVNAHLAGETALYDYTYRLRREGGEWLWIEAKGRCLRDPQTGRAVRYVGIMTDMSDRRRQEERLRQSEERLYSILEASPIAVNISTYDGRLIYCNPQLPRMLGWSREAMHTVNTPEFYADPDTRRRLIEKFDRHGPFRNEEIAFRHADGRLVWLLASWDRIEHEGQPALLTWLYDITDRKTAEAQIQAARAEAEQALAELHAAQESLIQAETMASLGQLVAGVAHEINTPIGIGVTAATHIAEQAANVRAGFDGGALKRSQLVEFFDQIGEGTRLLVSNLNRAAELVQSFKRVAVDQSSGDRRGFTLDAYVGEVLYSLRPRLKRAQAAVALDVPEGVAMDSFPGALSQVLTNLVINAVIHAYRDGAHDAGGAGVVVRVAAQVLEGGRVELVVEDSGVGMPEEVRRRIFEPFFTTRRGEGGSGLGLHIVHTLVTGPLGGTIAVDSEPGRGTRFTVILPLVAPQAAPACCD